MRSPWRRRQLRIAQELDQGGGNGVLVAALDEGASLAGPDPLVDRPRSPGDHRDGRGHNLEQGGGSRVGACDRDRDIGRRSTPGSSAQLDPLEANPVTDTELVDQTLELASSRPAPGCEQQARTRLLFDRPGERTHDDVEVRVRTVVTQGEHDERVVGPAEPGSQASVGTIGREAVELGVPDDLAHALGVGAELDRRAAVCLGVHDEEVRR